VRCPGFFTWGQDLGEGWEQLTAALPLERNRLYTLWMYLDNGHSADADFCIFKDGSVRFRPSESFEGGDFLFKECLEEV
jgi:hypothetical protein